MNNTKFQISIKKVERVLRTIRSKSIDSSIFLLSNCPQKAARLIRGNDLKEKLIIIITKRHFT